MLPKESTFFLDRNMGKKALPEALRKAGFTVEIHSDHFPEDAADEDWLKVVGQKGWIVITNDRRIRHRPIEWQSLLAYGVRAFAFTTGNLTAVEMAQILIGCHDRVLALLQANPGPFIATITKSGEVRVWKTI